jgi:hypothetical protein
MASIRPRATSIGDAGAGDADANGTGEGSAAAIEDPAETRTAKHNAVKENTHMTALLGGRACASSPPLKAPPPKPSR